MKKLLLISILLGSIILTGCSQKNEVKNQPTMTANEIFEKKQECAKHKSEIQKEIEEANQLYKKWKYFTHEEKLSEILYSPKKNSCLYTVDVIEEQEWKTCVFFKIYDFFWKGLEETYLEQDLEGNCNYQESEEKFNQALKELKWE